MRPRAQGVGKGPGANKKIIFRTGTCRVFTVDVDSVSALPEILFKQGDSIALPEIVFALGSQSPAASRTTIPRLGLYEESLVPVVLVGGEQSLVGRPQVAAGEDGLGAQPRVQGVARHAWSPRTDSSDRTPSTRT
ncbi:hypothetical protein E2562_030888 [Oryza meyeriana var. granulata]|nr:hypothetical protein E2562_030888 [Oryza meyeriana var. granulata]